MISSNLSTRIAFALLDNQPESVVYYIPVWSSSAGAGTPADFEIAYCNKEAAHLTGISQLELLGQRVSTLSETNDTVRSLLYRQLLQVYQSGQTVDDYYYNPVLKKHFSILRSKVEDGVLTVARNRTKELLEQEEKQRQSLLANSILDTSLNGIFACEAIRDASGTIIDLQMKRVNRAFTEMTSLQEAEVIGKTYLTLFPSSIANGTFAWNCQVINTGISDRKQMHYEGDNLNAWYDVSVSKLLPDGVLVTFSDITEQRKAFLQVGQQKTLLDNILRHSANGISVTRIIKNAAGNVVDGLTILANDAAVRFTGIPRDIYLSKRATELEPRIVESPYYQLCIKTLETGEPQFSQYYLESTKRWLEISISRLDNEHLITIFTDVTKTKEAQLYEQQLVEELKRSNANLEEFAHAASHDLKEPTRKVHFFTDRLKNKLGSRLDAEEVQLLERIETATERMRLLIDDLLEYSHVSHVTREKEAINLNDKLKLVLTDLEVLVLEKKATVTIGPMPVVMGYRRQLQQLFQNLINNALKYARPGVAPQVAISAQEVAGTDAGMELAAADLNKRFYRIEVKDNGIGFEPQDAQKIFQMFYRLHGRNEYSGTGVGLAIVRKVVENHGGYIWAESTLGAGATFSILLPAH